MYQDILITIIATILLLWFLHDNIFARFFYKPFKKVAKISGHTPDYYDVFGQLQAEFQKGNFEQVITLADKLLSERPFECSALSLKAFALYHLKRYAEATELFLLLDTLPNQDVSRMLKKKLES